MIPLALARIPWKLIGVGLLVIACLVQTLRLSQSERRADRLSFDLNECREGRKEDRASYERAQSEAALKNKQQIERITREQREISDEAARNLDSRLERLRRELQQKAAPAGGASQGARPGPDGNAAGGADGEAGLCLAPDQLLRAAENEERHDRLLDWIEQQLSVPRN